jgi:hypothetical protein
VEDAHKALRPKGVPASAKRQGEWFFIPATKDELAAIERSLHWHAVHPSLNPSVRGVRHGSLEWNSSHYATTLGTKSGVFAIGHVIDNRKSNRHSPLLLNGWHRVVRNAEVINAAAITRYWD